MKEPSGKQSEVGEREKGEEKGKERAKEKNMFKGKPIQSTITCTFIKTIIKIFNLQPPSKAHWLTCTFACFP